MDKEKILYWAGTIGHCLITLALSFIHIGFLSVGFFLGREIAQAEYRYIQANGGKRYDCPWYCGMIPSAWTLKSVLDWLLPMIIAIIMFIFY